MRAGASIGHSLGLALLFTGCNGLFYFPSAEHFATPAALGIDFRPFTIPSTDDVLLSAWVLEPVGPPRGLVVHFHGNAENMTTHFEFVGWLTRAGYTVLTFDYRGYGASTGQPDRVGMVDDGCAVLRWAARDPALGALDHFVLGQSLGGAIAIPSVVRCGGPRVRAVVIESSFASYRGVAWAKVKDNALLWPAAPAVLFVSGELDPVDDVPRLGRPLLVIHGDADGVVPWDQGQALYAAAREPRELWTIAGGGHTPSFRRAVGDRRQALVEYLERHAGHQYNQRPAPTSW